MQCEVVTVVDIQPRWAGRAHGRMQRALWTFGQRTDAETASSKQAYSLYNLRPALLRQTKTRGENE